MAVETLGEAYSLSWTLNMRCFDDGQEGLKHKQPCNYRHDLDLPTLWRLADQIFQSLGTAKVFELQL